MEKRRIWQHSTGPRKYPNINEKDTTENNRRRENSGVSTGRRRGANQIEGKKKIGGNFMETKFKSTMAERGGKEYKILP